MCRVGDAKDNIIQSGILKKEGIVIIHRQKKELNRHKTGNYTAISVYRTDII